MNSFQKAQANKILNCYNLEKSDYNNDESLLDNDFISLDIEKGKRHELVKVTRDGKTFFQNRLIGSDEEPQTSMDVGDFIYDDKTGLEIKQYSDKAFAIGGNTYANLDLLRDIKKEVGAGGWNAKLGSWIFPSSMKNEIFSKLSEKIDTSTYDGQVEKENAVAVKNSIPIGSTIIVNGQEVVITGIDAVNGSIEYEIQDNNKPNQEKEESEAVIDEKEINEHKESESDSKPSKETGKRGRKEVPIGTMSKDGKSIKTANGWEYIKTKKKEKDVGIPEQKETKKVDEIINDANPDNRFEKSKELFGKEEGESSVAEKLIDENFKYEAKKTKITAPSGVELDVKDYSDYPQRNIQIIKQEEILSKEKPSWLPDFNENYLLRKQFQFDYIQLDENRILLATGKGFELTNDYSYKPSPYNDYAIVSLDQLVATQDYMIKLAKAKQEELKNKEIAENLDKLRNAPDGFLTNYNAFSYSRLSTKQLKKYSKEQWEALSKEEKIVESEFFKKPLYSLSQNAKKRIGVMSENTMSLSNFRMYKFLINPNYTIPLRGFKSNDEGFLAYKEIRDALKWKRADLDMQREENDNSYDKGRETSWGDSGTRDDLLDDLGVKIKSQNGKEMTVDQIEDIKNSLSSVFESFGDRSSLAKKHNLKISHSGEKLMFARKALGLYVPSMNAIGVSNNQVHDKFGFTLAHEFAHFIDNKLGVQSGRNYASDDYNSLAGKIAVSFRKNMNEPPSSTYIGRTCECFARALEQYHAMLGDEDAIKSKINGVPYHKSPEHVSKDNFNNIIKPMIEELFKTNDSFLKSFVDNVKLFDNGLSEFEKSQANKILNSYNR